MSENTVIAESARKIVDDLTNEKNLVTASIESLETKLEGLRGKISEIDSAISIIVDTYRLKSRPVEIDSTKPTPGVRGRRKNSEIAKVVDGKKKKPIEIKTAVRDYIATTLDFPVKELVIAVRKVRPDAQQPSIQAELTKLLKSNELERVGYGQYRSKVFTGGSPTTSDVAETATSESTSDAAASAE